MIQVTSLRTEKAHCYPYGNLVMKKLKSIMLQTYALTIDIMTYLQYLMGQVSRTDVLII